MYKETQKALAKGVAKRVWGEQPTTKQTQKAKQMVEALINDDELVTGIPGMTAKAHIAVIYDEAVRRLTETTN